VQDIMQRLGLPVDRDAMTDPHQAAIALAVAMNQARIDMADRSGLKVEAQTYGAAKLEALRRKLMPLYAAIPRDVELFDLGLVTQERPRLYVDIIAFIEMNRDQTAFRFLQESRNGRITLAETDDDKTIIEEVTRYVARRLVEREHALENTAPIVLAAPKALPTIDAPMSVLAPDTPPRPEMPKAAAAPLLTAEEAFRQWSRPATVAPEPLLDPAPTIVTHGIDPTAVALDASPRLEPTSVAAVLAAPPATVGPIRKSIDTVEVASNLTPPMAVSAAATTPIVATDAVPKRSPASTAQPRFDPPSAPASRASGGWWIWPLLALLIGIGCGALGLFLFAASLAR
jgi:hypothetical protein